MRRQLFVDLDGVLADFDAHHENLFGVRPTKDGPDVVDWKKIEDSRGFFAGIPPMQYAKFLWRHVEPYRPIILTGIPSSVSEASANKCAWVAAHIGEHVPVICCQSKDKSRYAKPGDVLLDDWTKYRDLWTAKGGIFVHYTGYTEAVAELCRLGFR